MSRRRKTLAGANLDLQEIEPLYKKSSYSVREQ